MGQKNLDYLQWLQRNARLYLTGMAVLTFLLTLSFVFFTSNPWQPQQQKLAFWPGDDSDTTVAEQQVPEQQQNDATKPSTQLTENPAVEEQQVDPDTQTVVEALPKTEQTGTESEARSEAEADVIESDPLEQINQSDPTEQQTEQIDQSEPSSQSDQTESLSWSNQIDHAEPTIQTVDLQQLQSKLDGFTAPCRGALLYGYGVGYDPQCEDYRFHDGVCYQADGTAALAVADGLVQQVAMDEEWQLLVRCGDYLLCYRGLQSCEIEAGAAVTAGQTIGTAGERLYVQVRAEPQQ